MFRKRKPITSLDLVSAIVDLYKDWIPGNGGGAEYVQVDWDKVAAVLSKSHRKTTGYEMGAMMQYYVSPRNVLVADNGLVASNWVATLDDTGRELRIGADCPRAQLFHLRLGDKMNCVNIPCLRAIRDELLADAINHNEMINLSRSSTKSSRASSFFALCTLATLIIPNWPHIQATIDKLVASFVH